MPKRLLDRFRPDSVREFRAAARQRFDDGLVAEAGARRTAAIYLWGYAAEMTLKAAYYSASGFDEGREITRIDLNQAVNFGKGHRVQWPDKGRLHNLRAWAETLVIRRSSMPGTEYVRWPPFGVEVARRGQLLGRLWNESLRYHGNVAYGHEVRQVKNAVEWLLVHSSLL